MSFCVPLSYTYITHIHIYTITHIWVSFCRTGKMSKLCLISFETSLWSNGLIFSRFLNCSGQLLSYGVSRYIRFGPMIFLFWLVSSSSRNQVTTVWGLGDDGATNHHWKHRHGHQLQTVVTWILPFGHSEILTKNRHSLLISPSCRNWPIWCCWSALNIDKPLAKLHKIRCLCETTIRSLLNIF